MLSERLKIKPQSTQSTQRGVEEVAKHGSPKPLAVFALLAVKIKPPPRTQANSEAPLPRTQAGADRTSAGTALPRVFL
ncbi:hypothetical protein DYQ05_11010 [Treponema pedis]|nr:hypothetical protein DYQ05_11010 [Treponema pedis]